MDLKEKTIWQVAAGDKDRNYVDICLEWDVIIMGPGSEGAWPKCIPKLKEERDVSAKKLTDIKRFCEHIKDGDVVVLRLGTTEIYGIGIVKGDYGWSDHFGDIDGWDLQHFRRTKWVWKYDNEPKKFKKAYTLKFGDTVQLMDSQEVINWISQINFDSDLLNTPLVALPETPDETELSEVDFDAISEFLFGHGVASYSIQKLIDEIDELIRIARWYQKTTNPSESETIAYLVVPLLRTLGWTPQKMAIEWKNIDLALFSKLPRSEENLSVVVEAKPKDWSCLTAKSQAQYYVEQVGMASCQRLIVTDGLRYGVYLRKEGVFESNPTAYLNLTYLKSNYPILRCSGAKEALLIMSADWSPDSNEMD